MNITGLIEYVRKEGRLNINDLSILLKILEKDKQNPKWKNGN